MSDLVPFCCYIRENNRFSKKRKKPLSLQEGSLNVWRDTEGVETR